MDALAKRFGPWIGFFRGVYLMSVTDSIQSHRL